MENVWESRLRQLANQNKVPLIDFNKPSDLSCNYFSDINHLSFRCFTEMSHKIVENLKINQ
ncbi:MAG: DUF1574 family protein [Leptospiraceae bacterium]|nr:DUF1574 family protein [Leptospiraceae bacterium]